jgi:hypothetical protein
VKSLAEAYFSVDYHTVLFMPFSNPLHHKFTVPGLNSAIAYSCKLHFAPFFSFHTRTGIHWRSRPRNGAVGAAGLQCHHLCVRSDGQRQDIHDGRPPLQDWYAGAHAYHMCNVCLCKGTCVCCHISRVSLTRVLRVHFSVISPSLSHFNFNFTISFLRFILCLCACVFLSLHFTLGWPAHLFHPLRATRGRQDLCASCVRRDRTGTVWSGAASHAVHVCVDQCTSGGGAFRVLCEFAHIYRKIVHKKHSHM